MPTSFTAICTSDFSGLLRGKGVPSAEFDRRCTSGIGWTPTNALITCFDTIAASPYGALGDVVLRPDPSTRVDAPMPGGQLLSFALGSISDLAGNPWECCTRSLLAGAVERLLAETRIELKTTFEHEFMFDGPNRTPSFSLAGFHERTPYLEALSAALSAAGIAPDSALREYGPNQMEVTLPPCEPVRAADEAAILRDLARAVAAAMGERVTFSPLVAPDVVGNGVHIHFSLWREGRPVTHDPDASDGLSREAGAFVAGILRHAPALTALTAPSVVSYARLVPHRWSAAFNNLGRQDREATVRICPLTARDPAARSRQFNLEYRAADAAASPHLALAALIEAGRLGLRDGLAAPRATEDDLAAWPVDRLAAAGLQRLPASLDGALDALLADPVLTRAWPERFPAIYAAHKRAEIEHLADVTQSERFHRYAAVY